MHPLFHPFELLTSNPLIAFASHGISVAAATIPWREYRSLAPRTRLFHGLTAITWAGFGIYITNKADKASGMVLTGEDKRTSEEVLPKVTFVELSGRAGRAGGQS